MKLRRRDKVIPVEHLKRVDLGPSDMIVATVPSDLSADQLQAVEAGLKQAFGEERDIVVLMKGYELGVVRRADD